MTAVAIEDFTGALAVETATVANGDKDAALLNSILVVAGVVFVDAMVL